MSSGVAPSVSSPTLVGQIWPAGSDTRLALLRSATLVVLGTLLLALSAKVQVPFYPVPMTMQTLVVLVIGAAYGTRLAGATVGLYLLEGFAGLPVFAGAAAGPAYMAGPTGGFLLGFLAAALLTGFLGERGWNRGVVRAVAAMTLGHAVIFAFGLGWLATLLPLDKVWAAGAAPFALATLLKTGLAAALLLGVARLVPQSGR